MPGTYVALLRGINVGGNNKLPMQDLARLFSQAGCHEVKTYIQSGNVIFKAEAALVPTLAEDISQAIERNTGMRIPVVIRTRDELAAVARNNPFLEGDAEAEALNVMFLADKPSAQAIAGLDPQRSPSDAFIVVDREIYLHCPNGLARTKLTNEYFDKKLGTISTCRNWRTTLKLIELANA